MADFKVVLPVLMAFAISVILGPFIIPYLRKLKMGQTERTEGVQSHLKKAGTPTMGGIIFLLSTTITSLFFVKDYPKIIPVLFLTLGFGIIGFLDENSLVRRLGYEREISQLKEEIEKYRTDYEENTKRLNEISTNPDAIEQIAREKYLMKKPNEDIYVFEEE